MLTDTMQYRKIRAIHTLRVNVKSLAHESRIIRHETARAGKDYKQLLTLHRRVTLRQDARAAQLALAFVRGRTYRSVENKTAPASRYCRLVLLDRIEKKLGKHYTWPLPITKENLEKWLSESPCTE